MSELLAVSVTFNLFLLYRYLVLHRQHRVVVTTLFRIGIGELGIKCDKKTRQIEIVETKQA